MFSVIKVREGLAPDDYRDPGAYRHPAGTVAYEFKGNAGEPTRRTAAAASTPPAAEFNVIKPGGKPPHEH
jgi:manganese oxidase